MPEQVIWTVLPGGRMGDDGARRLRLSVLASPRLTTTDGTDGTLAQFEDFRRWPATMAATTFDLEVDGSVVAERLQPRNQLDPTLWTALFSDDTLVRSHAFADPTARPLASYPVRPLLRSLQGLYGRTALDASDGLPPAFGGKKGKGGLLGTLGSSEFRPDPADRAGKKPITRFQRFHDRPRRPHLPLPDQEDLDKLLDFHQVVSCLANYPRLLRLLGLVFDLELPADAFAPSDNARRVRARPRWQPADPASPTPDRSPTTMARWDGINFRAVAQRTDIRGGLLALDPAKFDLVQVDVEGAGHKLVNLTLNLAHQQSAKAPDTPERAGLPTLRSAGLSVVQLGRATELAQRLARAKADNQTLEAGRPEDVVLHAEQLVRGFRIDIWDSQSQTWRSVCRRLGTYRFTSTGVERPIEDEGFVQLSAAGVPSGPPGPHPDLYLHEALLRWDGWSLAANRPGLSLAPSNDPSAKPIRPENSPVTPYNLQTSFRPPPKSLPQLRFGRGYRIRARLTDLAGNSLEVAEAGEADALPAAPPGRAYLRYEPVPPPLLVLRKKLTAAESPGESLERLVIRTANADPDLDHASTAKPNDRHVAPPRTTAVLAETHGMFDDDSGRLRGDDATHAMIAQRDNAQLADDGGTPVEPAEKLSVPYLPDPLARGAALRALPGAPEGTVGRPGPTGELAYEPPPVITRPGSVTMIDFGPADGWPALQPFRIVLREGDGEPEWDSGGRVLTVALPKASTRVVPLSSYFDRGDLDLMGVWQWLREEVESRRLTTDRAALRALGVAVAHATQRAIEGGHWMLSPARDLVLVHAVQQPLGHPVIEALAATREFDDTKASILGSLRVHGASTAKVELLASWGEFVDAGPTPDVPLPSQGELAELPLRRLSGDGGFVDIVFGGRLVGTYRPRADRIELTRAIHPQHVFADTRHRVLRCRAVSTSRFAEYFRRRRQVTLSGAADVVVDPGGIVPGSDVVRTLDGAVTFSRDVDYRIDNPAGAVARLPAGAIPDGAGVDVDYLPPVSRESQDAVVVHVPSSVRPAAPDVQYVVPLFEWKRQTRTNVLASERWGGWLRVYLGRSWWSSGEGEMLGVVVNDEPGTDLLPYVTQWGKDPVRAGPTIRSIELEPAHAVDLGPVTAGGTSIGLTLSELPPTLANRVDVFAFRVEFDPSSDLWYCDIPVRTDPEAFQPFVRLALARYQPHSVERFDPEDPESARDVKLSRVVLADFAQLSADRSVLVTYDPQRPQVLRVVVSGHTYEHPAGQDAGNEVTVELEERRPGAVDELGWMPAAGVSVQREMTNPGGTFVPADTLLWRGEVTLPADRSVDDYRLVVKEFDTLPGGEPPRVLYADALELESLAPSRAPSRSSLASSPNPSKVGQTVTFTATVAAEGDDAPTGNVTFTDGGVTLGTVPLRDGTAVLTTADLTPGTHQVSAAYPGDATYKPSRASVVQRVEKAETEVDVVPRLEIHGKTPF